jgi:hypothetical protein
MKLQPVGGKKQYQRSFGQYICYSDDSPPNNFVNAEVSARTEGRKCGKALEVLNVCCKYRSLTAWYTLRGVPILPHQMGIYPV